MRPAGSVACLKAVCRAPDWECADDSRILVKMTETDSDFLIVRRNIYTAWINRSLKRIKLLVLSNATAAAKKTTVIDGASRLTSERPLQLSLIDPSGRLYEQDLF